RVRASEHVQHQCGVTYRTGDWAGVSRQHRGATRMRDEPEGGLESEAATESGRDTDRSRAVTTLSQRTQPGGNRRSRAATRSTSRAPVLPRIVGGTDDQVSGITLPT